MNAEVREFLLEVDRGLQPEAGEMNVHFLSGGSVQLGEETPPEIRGVTEFTLYKKHFNVERPSRQAQKINCCIKYYECNAY